MNWMAGIFAPCFFFFFFLSACWGYLCIYDFLEETGGSALALCACQSEREAKRVSMWVSPLATYWADEVFWTEKEGFPRTWEGIHRRLLRKFGLNSGSSPQWISFLRSRRILELLQTLDAGLLPCSLIVWTCFPVVFWSALLQSFLLFMPCFGCVLCSGWAGTGSLWSGRTGCSTRSQQKSPVPFPKPCRMKPKATQSRITPG